MCLLYYPFSLCQISPNCALRYLEGKKARDISHSPVISCAFPTPSTPTQKRKRSFSLGAGACNQVAILVG